MRKSKIKEISNIHCSYQFYDISRPDEKKLIEKAIKSVAIGKVNEYGPFEQPRYEFTVKNLRDLDYINPRILYKNPGAKEKDLRQIFNIRNPSFGVIYDSTDISASMNVIVTFSINPGARLFYKDEGGGEEEITSEVDSSGKVTLQTKIKKGQEYIFAKTVEDDVERYIKINVYSQEVSDMDKSEYE